MVRWEGCDQGCSWQIKHEDSIWKTGCLLLNTRPMLVIVNYSSSHLQSQPLIKIFITNSLIFAHGDSSGGAGSGSQGKSQPGVSNLRVPVSVHLMQRVKQRRSCTRVGGEGRAVR